MSMAEFRRFIENTALRITKEETNDLIRHLKLDTQRQKDYLTYYDFRQIFASAEKTQEGWGGLSKHIRRKLLPNREWLEGTMRAADTGCSGTLTRAIVKRVLSSHLLNLSPSEIEQCVEAAPSLADGGSAGRIDYAELLRGLGFSASSLATDVSNLPESSSPGYVPGVDVPGQTVSHKQYLGFVPGTSVPAAIGAGAGGAYHHSHGSSGASAAVLPGQQEQWMQEAEAALHHGNNKLNFMAQSAVDDLDAGVSQWQGRPDLAKSPAFTAWFVQMKTQLSHLVTHYDRVVQDLHQRLGVFSTPGGVVDRLGLHRSDLRHPKSTLKSSAAAKVTHRYRPGDAAREFGGGLE
eukprot:SAG31_NODE_3585_length_4096_cov_14.959470_1_plen_349_part_00